MNETLIQKALWLCRGVFSIFWEGRNIHPGLRGVSGFYAPDH